MSTATFSEQGHLYELDGKAIPSVTQVLTLSGISDISGVPLHLIERAGVIGTAVHEACQYLDEDDLDLESLALEVLPYVVAYQRFREESEFKPELIEHRMTASYQDMPYGLCIDRIGRVKERRIVLDLKTSSKRQASWAIQTAAYASAMPEDCDRWVVHLAKDGSYKIVRYEDNSDYKTWLAALTVAHWRLANGVKIK